MEHTFNGTIQRPIPHFHFPIGILLNLLHNFIPMFFTSRQAQQNMEYGGGKWSWFQCSFHKKDCMSVTDICQEIVVALFPSGSTMNFELGNKSFHLPKAKKAQTTKKQPNVLIGIFK